MDTIEKVESNIKQYIQEKFNFSSQDNISLKLIRMNSLSNDIYHSIVTDTTTNEIIDEICYRNFGEIGDIVNRPLEESVINSLGNQGIGPKIFSTDHKTYRIDEFIQNSSPIPHDALKTEAILSQMIPVLVSYSEIAPIYRYSFSEDPNEKKINVEEFKENIDAPVKTTQNIYDMCMKDMCKKGLSKLDKFIKDARMNNNTDKEFLMKLDSISTFASHLTEIFDKAFPQSGFFSLNHNDTLRLNLLLKDEKILIIDHEYGGLNLPGFDIVNYVVETNFDYSPSYEFYPNEIDLKAYYEIFVKFLNAFEKSEKHSYFVNSEEGKNEIKKYKSFEYFTNLVILDNILWFVFALIYFDYEKIMNGKSFNYFQHAFDRVTYYNAVKEFIGMEIEDKVDI